MTDTTKAAALAAVADAKFYAAEFDKALATTEVTRAHGVRIASALRTLLDGITTQAARIAELEANGVHSCHPECPRPVCVLQRRVAELEAERAGLVAAERERLCEALKIEMQHSAWDGVLQLDDALRNIADALAQGLNGPS